MLVITNMGVRPDYCLTIRLSVGCTVLVADDPPIPHTVWVATGASVTR